tara:strand:+ start:5689 stop:6423 length:735 start_codon:yes stop_codon:yes gene_type:complete
MIEEDFFEGHCSVAIFGGHGGGAVVAQSVRSLGSAGNAVNCIGFLNDTHAPGSLIGDLTVLGAFESWVDLNNETQFIAPLHKAGEATLRFERIIQLGIPSHRWCNVIDPNSKVDNSVKVCHGTTIAPYVVVQPDVQIGSHVAIRSGVTIGHNSIISDHTFIGSNAVLCGYVTVGFGAHIAPGAAIRENTKIGRFSVVGLGAIVVDDVPDYSVVAGNPARIIHNLLNEKRSHQHISSYSSGIKTE